MEKIIEYAISIEGECHSIHSTLKEARKVFNSIINLYEIEGKKGKIELISKTINYKTLTEYNLCDNIYTPNEFLKNIEI